MIGFTSKRTVTALMRKSRSREVQSLGWGLTAWSAPQPPALDPTHCLASPPLLPVRPHTAHTWLKGWQPPARPPGSLSGVWRLSYSAWPGASVFGATCSASLMGKGRSESRTQAFPVSARAASPGGHPAPAFGLCWGAPPLPLVVHPLSQPRRLTGRGLSSCCCFFKIDLFI